MGPIDTPCSYRSRSSSSLVVGAFGGVVIPNAVSVIAQDARPFLSSAESPTPKGVTRRKRMHATITAAKHEEAPNEPNAPATSTADHASPRKEPAIP